MSILNNKKRENNNYYSRTPVFKKVVAYCLPQELSMTLFPFLLVVISLIMASFKAVWAAEFITFYIAFPLAVIVPLLLTVKQISVLKSSFPRKKDDSHRVILSVFFSTLLCILLLIVLFCVSCSLFELFPMDFRAAAYMRDMYTSSPAAMIITYITVYIAYALLSLMSTTAYFLGEATKKKFSFTISCMIFLGMYVALLILFLLAYFAATFLDIKALEAIQIANSIFNSSMLCSFSTFIIIAIAAMPILYCINYKALTKLDVIKNQK